MGRFLLIILLTQMTGAVHLASQKAQRLSFQKKKIVLKSPERYEKPIVGYNPNTGAPIYYDPKPRVVLLDAKSGTHALRWIGSDGQQKTITYQRPDAIDVVVRASVTRTASGEYAYIYHVQNLPSSGEHLTIFAVQNFSAHMTFEKIKNVYIGRMSNNKVMKAGNWISFGLLKPIVVPGRNIELRLLSSAPPGFVESRVMGGVLGMKGVGEEMPQELANILPGYEAWPVGYTIGPVDELKTLSPAKGAEYIRSKLARFQQVGWMTANSVAWYEQNLRGDNLETIHKRAEQDLKAGKITTEVFAMIQSIRQ